MRALAALILVLPVQIGCDGETVIHGTTKLADTQDRLGPYAVVTDVSDPDGVDSVSLLYRAGSTDLVELAMDEVSGGVYEAAIPGQPPFTSVEYFVVASDAGTDVTDPPGALDSTANRYRFSVLSSKCSADIDCGPGEFCDTSSLCRQHVGACTTDAECGKGMRCWTDGACRLAARACLLDESCLVGEVCDAILKECAPRPICDELLTCPLDYSCDEKDQVCRRSCMGTADCGPGESCKAGVCSGAKSCVKAGDCGAQLICDTVGGYCRPEGAGLCAVCVIDADCGGPTDFCLLLSDGQFCGKDCSAAVCPGGYSCSDSTVPPQCVPDLGVCSGS